MVVLEHRACRARCRRGVGVHIAGWVCIVPGCGVGHNEEKEEVKEEAKESACSFSSSFVAGAAAVAGAATAGAVAVSGAAGASRCLS